MTGRLRPQALAALPLPPGGAGVGVYTGAVLVASFGDATDRTSSS